MRNIPEIFVDELKPRILRSMNFFLKNSAIYDIMWENTLQSERPQMTIWPMRFACWLPKARDAHTEYVIIIAFPTVRVTALKPFSVTLHVHY
jgi:hypothetical protein